MLTIGEVIFAEMWDCKQADNSQQLERIWAEADDKGKELINQVLLCLCEKTWAQLVSLQQGGTG